MLSIKKIWRYCSYHPSVDATLRFVRDNDNCRVYYNLDNMNCIIAFDGSNDLKDWVSNLRASKTGGVHIGLQLSFDKFVHDLVNLLQNWQTGVIFTGHSRGGALATIAARHFAKHNLLKSCSCVTFGASKVGDQDFRNEYNLLPIDHTGYRNGWDIFTYSPPGVTGYRHVGKIVRLKRPWYRKYLLTFRIRDHFMAAYDKAINELKG